MEEKFCPLISNNEKKVACQRVDCTLFDTEYSQCSIKTLKQKKITVEDGCKIAIGFTLWSLLIGFILFLLIWFILPEKKECTTNILTGEMVCK